MWLRKSLQKQVLLVKASKFSTDLLGALANDDYALRAKKKLNISTINRKFNAA